SLEKPRLERVRLYVHENNPRAAAFYRRFGFVPTGGESVPMPGDPSARELEYEVERPEP
nr:GNAT family N-acetyltransferase [Streptomyces sp. SID7803]